MWQRCVCVTVKFKIIAELAVSLVFTEAKDLFDCLHLQGANASALEKEIGSEQFPVNEHYFGLVNVSE